MTTTTTVQFAATMGPAEEDQARADMYSLLARLLFAPPDAYLYQNLAAAPVRLGAVQPLEQAWAALANAAARIPLQAVRDEYDALFVSIAAPKVNPFASLYQAGFLHEGPLVELRADLARLGLARRSGSGDTEDHLGALCETMRVLIAGSGGRAPQPVEVQRRFWMAHIAPWYARCLADLRSQPEACFYAFVADLSEAFLAVEATAFELETEPWM
ncbi:TorD/DmsD family molecular chaperone [Zemynaea arenosa]|nr:molecular chaperone TorD family protein [Massilia arenosa]